VQSPSWEANWFAASQEIPRISRNPKVQYCTQKRPPPVYTYTLHTPLSSSIRATCPAHLILLDFITRTTTTLSIIVILTESYKRTIWKKNSQISEDDIKFILKKSFCLVY